MKIYDTSKAKLPTQPLTEEEQKALKKFLNTYEIKIKEFCRWFSGGNKELYNALMDLTIGKIIFWGIYKDQILNKIGSVDAYLLTTIKHLVIDLEGPKVKKRERIKKDINPDLISRFKLLKTEYGSTHVNIPVYKIDSIELERLIELSLGELQEDDRIVIKYNLNDLELKIFVIRILNGYNNEETKSILGLTKRRCVYEKCFRSMSQKIRELLK